MSSSKHYSLTLTREIMRVMRKLNIPDVVCVPLNKLRHKYILSKLMPYFKNAYTQMLEKKQSDTPNNDIIWMFWWQGYSNMPTIVKACIRSVKINYNSSKVILITKNNIWDYAKVPKYVWSKFKNGNMKTAHFSDIVRFYLLQRYGGLWVDSTVFCTNPITDKYFSDGLYTAHGDSNPNDYYISSKWTSFLIGSSKNNPLSIFMYEFYKNYWKFNDYIIDYFMLDYALYYAYVNNIGKFKEYVDTKAVRNNPQLSKLMNLLNKPFDLNTYKHITSDTNMFKLTYKKRFKKDRNTFYYRILKDYK